MSGAGFLAGTMSPAHTPAIRDRVCSPTTDRSTASTLLRRGGGRDGDLPPGVEGLLDEPLDARTAREPALVDQLDVDLALALVRGDDLLVELVPGAEVDLGVGGEVAAHPLLAPADLEQDGVLLLGPAEREAQLLEGLVEGHEVAVALGVGQHAVAVEDQRPGHAVTTLAAAPALPSWSHVLADGALHGLGDLVEHLHRLPLPLRLRLGDVRLGRPHVGRASAWSTG